MGASGLDATLKSHLIDDMKTLEEEAPLKGRLATLDAEVTSLNNRVDVIAAEVGNGAGGEAPALFGTATLQKEYANYEALLHSKSDTSALVDTVEDLEKRTADLDSRILQLENKVDSTLTADGANTASLLTVKARGASLQERTIELEGRVSSMRARVTSLEQTVV